MSDSQPLRQHIRHLDWPTALQSLRAVALVVLVSAILFALMIPAIQVGTWNDDAAYINVARSLLQGHGLSLTYLPTDLVYPIVPVGYPLVLAPLVFLFPNSFLPLKLLSSVFLLAAVVLVYHWARPRTGRPLALLVAALLGTNVAIVQSAAQVMWRALFVLTLLTALIQTGRFVQLGAPRGGDVLLAGVLLTLPLSVRYLGLPVVVALIAYVLWRRRDRFALTAVVVGLVSWAVINLGPGG
jgi:4-amino-4-deoxy-L-arabinose transferase-like glycosyltransferase